MLYSPTKGDLFLVIRMILHFLVLIVILFILRQQKKSHFEKRTDLLEY